jgi:hypothetical protein
MSKHTDFIFTCASVEDNDKTMNYIQAMHENKFNTNQVHDNSPVRGMYDKMCMTRRRRNQGPRMNQLTCCFGDVQPIERQREDVHHDLSNEKWLESNKCN